MLTLVTTPNKNQNATVRASTPLHPSKTIDPNSPSYGNAKIEKEREELAPLLEYLHSHIPTINSPKLTKTPLNKSTILKAAVKNIEIGPNAHFQSHTIFSHNQLSQMVLQVEIDLDLKDDKKRSNLERMQEGLAPLGPDFKSINLHHINQENGLLAELTTRTHQKHYGILHTRLEQSHIDRPEFDQFRTAYWRHRAKFLSPAKKPLAKSLFGSPSSLPIQKTILLKKKK
ncbi:MAG: HNH/ENDO VII family nuclease [Alphaproteobacteria bacterium]